MLLGLFFACYLLLVCLHSLWIGVQTSTMGVAFCKDKQAQNVRTLLDPRTCDCFFLQLHLELYLIFCNYSKITLEKYRALLCMSRTASYKRIAHRRLYTTSPVYSMQPPGPLPGGRRLLQCFPLG